MATTNPKTKIELLDGALQKLHVYLHDKDANVLTAVDYLQSLIDWAAPEGDTSNPPPPPPPPPGH